MSKELEAMKKAATTENIEDPKVLDSVMNGFLDLKYRVLAGDKEANGFVARDIARGFDLDAEKVADLKMRDILILLGYEPAAPWYEFPEEDAWFYEDYKDKRLCSAWNCFALASVILGRAGSVPVLKQFLQADYWSFIKFIGERMTESYDEKDRASREVMRRGMRLNRLFSDTERFVHENNRSLDQKDHTLEDVLSTAHKTGSRGWACGAIPISMYMERTVRSFEVIRDLLLDCIRMNLIKSDRDEFRAILDRCSKTGRYDDELFSQLDFSVCYE